MIPPGWGTNPSQVSSQQTLVLIYLPGRIESRVGLGGKKVAQIFKSWQSRGSNWGPCGRKAEILPTAPANGPQNTSNYHINAGSNRQFIAG